MAPLLLGSPSAMAAPNTTTATTIVVATTAAIGTAIAASATAQDAPKQRSAYKHSKVATYYPIETHQSKDLIWDALLHVLYPRPTRGRYEMTPAGQERTPSSKATSQLGTDKQCERGKRRT